MPMKLLLLHLSIFFISLPSSYSCTYNVKKTLLQIKNSLNNPSDLSNWNPKTDCCSGWTGVECTNRRVTVFRITAGEFPGQIGDLPDLKTLEFTYLSHFTGNIPRSITKLKNLELLRIKETKLSGPIPDYISELKSLTYLDLSFNQFTGPIPGSLSQMLNLDAILLNDNKLTGPIPNSFGSFVDRFPNLYLSHNKLSGRIPKSLSKKDFNAVDLSGNGFIGDGSMFFGRNKTSVRVDLSRNMFQFDISKIKLARSIISLDLSQNKIFGKIPMGFTKQFLTNFNVSYNRLCGEIPHGGRGLLQGFEPSVYSHNLCLCGAPLKAC